MNICQCGCGGLARKRFISGHNSYGKNNPMYGVHLISSNKGKPMSEEQKRKISASRMGKYIGKDNSFFGKKHSVQTIFKMSGVNNWQWKGDDVGYTALHDWLEKRISRPNRCPRCKLPVECMECHRKIKLELANISGIYDRDLENWDWMCVKCHRKFDNYIRDPKTGRFIKRKMDFKLS